VYADVRSEAARKKNTEISIGPKREGKKKMKKKMKKTGCSQVWFPKILTSSFTSPPGLSRRTKKKKGKTCLECTVYTSKEVNPKLETCRTPRTDGTLERANR
jgi:hypothetical protein